MKTGCRKSFSRVLYKRKKGLLWKKEDLRLEKQRRGEGASEASRGMKEQREREKIR